MTHDVERVEHNPGVGRVLRHRVAERLPHIDSSKLDAGARLLTQLLEKQINVGLRPALTANPDGPFPVQIADDDTVVMTFADRQLVDPDGARCRQACTRYLLLHVKLVQLFHRAVM